MLNIHGVIKTWTPPQYKISHFIGNVMFLVSNSQISAYFVLSRYVALKSQHLTAQESLSSFGTDV